MKKTLFLIITLIFSVALLLVNSFAQDWTRIGLPEGAKARLGKGQITDLAFSPDGAWFAVDEFSRGVDSRCTYLPRIHTPHRAHKPR